MNNWYNHLLLSKTEKFCDKCKGNMKPFKDPSGLMRLKVSDKKCTCMITTLYCDLDYSKHYERNGRLKMKTMCSYQERMQKLKLHKAGMV